MAAQSPGGARQTASPSQQETKPQEGKERSIEPRGRAQVQRGSYDPWRESPLARFSELTTPFGMLGRLMNEMDRVFGAFGGGGLTGATQVWNPQLEVFRRGDEVVVRADLPGIKEDQVHVEVDEGVLTISGERRDDRTEEREGYYHSERSYGSFRRSLALPEGVDGDKIEASFESGVLEVVIPVPEQKAKGRSVQIGQKRKEPQQGPPQPAAQKNKNN